METTSLFETVACPGCESKEHSVMRPARYPETITAGDLKQMYCASSSHVLLDQVVQCRKCQLVFVNPRPEESLMIGGYSDAEDPLFAQQNDQRIKTFYKSLGSVLKKLNYSAKGKKVLDVGCAGGAFLVAARERGFDARGIEPARWMAAYGRRTYNVDIRDGILEPGIYPEQSFDMITLWDVLEHLPKPHETLSLIHSLLKPDGILLVNYPDIGSWAARLLGEKWPFWLSVHLLYYTRPTVDAQLKRAQFAPQWYEPYWQTLPAGYVFERATPYVKPLGVVPPMLKAIGLAEMPLRYNMGQTLVVAKAIMGA
jgi:2-polyprenyl-3-methyl-5-hydroxy-6-metoxy-1,4-benzoquinol methylase